MPTNPIVRYPRATRGLRGNTDEIQAYAFEMALPDLTNIAAFAEGAHGRCGHFGKPNSGNGSHLGLACIHKQMPIRCCRERRGRDSNPRDALRRLPVFKTGAFNRSATPPGST